MLSEQDLNISHVYKFIKISNDRCYRCGKSQTDYFNRFKNLIHENQLYFSKPSSFNDPFDCLVDFEDKIKEKDFCISGTRKKFHKFLKKWGFRAFRA